MGILLPPVSQVTNTRINLTQHHRNRSLDSALQRIPEVNIGNCILNKIYSQLFCINFGFGVSVVANQVEISSPNAESENSLCPNSILGTTMCSKITSSSSTNPNNTPIAVCSKVNVIGMFDADFMRLFSFKLVNVKC